MPRWLTRIALLSCCLALVAYAYAPLADADFLGRDVTHVVDTSRLAWPRELERDGERTADLLWSRDGERRPLATLSLALSSRLWTQRGAWSRTGFIAARAENLALLLASAFVLALCIRRALIPWLGSEGAGSAAWAGAFVLACHPLCAWVVFHPAARGDLLAMLLGCTSAVLFLRGRQEREPAPVLVAAACAVACGFASDLAWFLPAGLAALELSSARRYRPIHVRLRTTATTFLVFTGCIAIERFSAAAARAALSATDPWHDLLNTASSPARERVLAKLACLVLPVSPASNGIVGWIMCGAMLLAAFHPALMGARSAPKMWASLGLAWCAALVAFAMRRASVPIGPSDFSNAAVLFPGAVVMSAALGVASSALSGVRRTLAPLVVATCAAVLAHGASSTFPGAASALRSLREDLLQARVLHGNDVRLLVIDPPERASGLAILDGAMPLLLDPALAVEEPSSIAANRPPQRTWVRPISLRALFALVPQTEFDELRRAKLVLVFPEALVHPGAAPPEKRTWMRVSEPSAENARVFWRELARSKLLDLDPLAMRCVRVLALPAASTAEAPELDWRASSETFKYGVKSGVWSKESATDGPVAMFDLSRSFPWLCGKVVRSLSIQQAQAQIVYSEALADAPSPPSAATIAAPGDDWIASVASEALPRPIAGDARWVLELLDLSNYRFEEFQAEPSAAKEIVFRGAAVFERTAARARNPIAWTLAYRVGETDLLRQRGRRP